MPDRPRRENIPASEITFDGIPLLHLPDADRERPPARADSVPLPRSTRQDTPCGGPDSPYGPRTLADLIARGVQHAHVSVLDSHRAIERWQANRAARRDAVPFRDDPRSPSHAAPTTGALAPHGTTDHEPEPSHGTPPPDGAGEPPRRGHRSDSRPLARTPVRRMSAADLDALAGGAIASLLGVAYDQSHVSPRLRPRPSRIRALEAITDIDPSAGRHGLGTVTATVRPIVGGDPLPHLVAAAHEALHVWALHHGMHLCVPAAHVVPLPKSPANVEVLDPEPTHGGTLGLTLEIVTTGMAPQPFVTADGVIDSAEGHTIARLVGLGVALHGSPEDAPARSGPRSLRLMTSGEPALVDERHLARVGEEEPEPLTGAPGTTRSQATARPRPPRGDMLMVDRGTLVERPDKADGEGARGSCEYDMPGDPWYCRESGSTTPPPLALMEMALQPAGLLAAELGVTERYPNQTFVCRNLEGRARLLHPLDARGRTVGQRVRLRSAADLPGVLMHTYDFELEAGGSTFYTGEAVHGYFTEEVLAAQQGLDRGKTTSPWLDHRRSRAAGAIRFDAGRDPRLGHGRMALLEDVTVIPTGGEHGRGYVLCDKSVRPDDWFFDRHFADDPVMPGSAGVQMLHHAVQAFALYTGLTDHLAHPRFQPAVGEELHWSYRGQILREHHRVRGEVHLRETHRAHDRLFLRADGSVWRDDLRIYHVENITLVASPRATQETATR